ncbi:MAG: RNA polymerase sigma factor [Planctomycetaceae bacterium]
MSANHNEDDQRMIRLQGGETAAFDEIVAAWQSPLFGFFIRRLHDAQQAEDLVQETLLRVFRKSWNFIPTGNFRGWLFRIAHNLLVDDVRRRSGDALVRRVTSTISVDGDPVDLLSLMPDDLVPVEDHVSRQETSEVIRELIEQLPDDQKQTFLMHHFDGLTLSEVADAMETALPTAKSRLRLAREKLRYQLVCRGIVDEVVTDST